MKKFHLLIYFCAILFNACKKEMVPPPTFDLAVTDINLGALSSNTKSAFSVHKTGEGTISYTASSDKNWLILDKTSGNANNITDSISFHVALTASDIIEGNNTASITLTPTINNVLGVARTIKVSGNYQNSKLLRNISSKGTDTLKTEILKTIVLSKSGLEDVTYALSSDVNWISISKNTGTLKSQSDSIVIKINPLLAKPGLNNGIISISSSALGISAEPIKIPVSMFYDDTISGDIPGHTLTINETWTGRVNLLGNLVVPEGFTLTLKPGTQVLVSKLPSVIEIIVKGNLIMNGTSDQIIEINSNDANPKFGDWDGLKVNGNIYISYAIIRHTLAALNFNNSNIDNTPVIHHVLFDSDNICILSLKSNNLTTLSNLTFRNNGLFGITSQAPQVNLINCEFLNENCYLDFKMDVNNGVINMNNCNFPTKTVRTNNNLEISPSNANTTVTANGCYNINAIYNFGMNNNTFNNVNKANSANTNIGCGFANRFPMGRVRSVINLNSKYALK